MLNASVTLLVGLVIALLGWWRSRETIKTDADEEPTHFETTAAEQRNGAAHEEFLMAHAPQEGAAPVPVEQALRPLSTDGVVHIETVLDDALASALLTHVTEQLAQPIEPQADEPAVLVGAAGTLGNADHGGSGGHSGSSAPSTRFRHDLKLDVAQPVVREALTQVVGVVGSAVAHMLGPLAELHECGALVAEPGAHQQPLHPDTAWSESAAVCVVFVA